MVRGLIYGMSPRAINQPSASLVARSPAIRLRDMPRCASLHFTTSAPSASNMSRSALSSARTTTMQRETAEARFRHDATPIDVPSGSCASNLPPPKRLPLPAASRMALIIIADACTWPALRCAQHAAIEGPVCHGPGADCLRNTCGFHPILIERLCADISRCEDCALPADW